ncbi:MFS transporter [Algivirga pacifica]|uniref:MFS transporter n=1 Tax=Algivirga pacifica TaxID=1162670 RepID=A0ABP9DDW7_9BACT
MSLTKKELFNLYLLAGVSFTNILDFMVMMPLGHEFQTRFSLTPPMWSMVISSYTFAAGISGLVSIFFIDRIERKKFLLMLYGGFLVGTLGCAFAFDYYSLMGARAFTGVFGGIINALLFAIIGDMIVPQLRGRAMGILMMGFSGASALGVPFGLYFGVTFSWRVPFISIVLIGMVIWVLLYRNLPTMPHISQAARDTVKELKKMLKNSNQLIALGAIFLLFFGHFIVIPFLAPYMVVNVGFKEQDLTWIYLIGGIATIFSSPLVGKLSDDYGKFKMVALLSLTAMIPMWLVTHLEPTPIPLVLFYTTLFFVSGSRFIPSNALVLSTAPPQQRGVFMSVRTAMQQFASASASFLAGFIVTMSAEGFYQNYEVTGYLAIGITFLSAIALKMIQEKY